MKFKTETQQKNISKAKNSIKLINLQPEREGDRGVCEAVGGDCQYQERKRKMTINPTDIKRILRWYYKEQLYTQKINIYTENLLVTLKQNTCFAYKNGKNFKE